MASIYRPPSSAALETIGELYDMVIARMGK